MKIIEKIGFVLLGMVIAAALFFAVVGIASAVNGVAFGEQIVQWFGTAKQAVDTGAEQLANMAANIKI